MSSFFRHCAMFSLFICFRALSQKLPASCVRQGKHGMESGKISRYFARRHGLQNKIVVNRRRKRKYNYVTDTYKDGHDYDRLLPQDVCPVRLIPGFSDSAGMNFARLLHNTSFRSQLFEDLSLSNQ